MASDIPAEDYPLEIKEYLTGFESSVSSVKTMLQTLMSISRNDLEKLDPLEQAKLDLMSAYTLNSLFWSKYMCSQVCVCSGRSERIRTYMNRVKEITDKKKAARLDKGAAARFVRNALYDAEEGGSKKGAESKSKKAASTPADTPEPKRSKHS
uniref:Nuclear nucleic acid-binding protein C1D n=1 Tax=Myripristis murdjan TaxID=586833 RepID=A0A667X669_9TELE